MATTGFDVAVAAFVDALDGRLAAGVVTFPDLFTDDAVIEVPFDGEGDSPPIVGRLAVEAMVAGLDGFLHFEQAKFSAVRQTDDPAVLVCEYETVLRRADRVGALRRRYIAVVTLRDGRIAHLREYGGPFRSAA